jgi:glycolate oxidase
VPRTKLPEVLNKVIRIGEKYNLPIGNVFHAGDGNLHPLIMFDERDPEEKERVQKAASEILKACADAGAPSAVSTGWDSKNCGKLIYLL